MQVRVGLPFSWGSSGTFRERKCVDSQAQNRKIEYDHSVKAVVSLFAECDAEPEKRQLTGPLINPDTNPKNIHHDRMSNM